LEEGIIIKNISLAYSSLKVFENFSVSFKERQINCILGPSGCGKTSLLNILAESVLPDSGDIAALKSHKLSYVFQEPRLLPWKTTFQNLLFTLSDILPIEEAHEQAMQYLKLVELEAFSDYYPHKLSGGMKQRVSLARAFSYPSDIILMDEPFKALDIKLKKNLIARFLDIWKNDNRTVIFVTHDVDEAIQLGQYIKVLSGPPAQIQGEFKAGDKNLRNKIVGLLDS